MIRLNCVRHEGEGEHKASLNWSNPLQKKQWMTILIHGEGGTMKPGKLINLRLQPHENTQGAA